MAAGMQPTLAQINTQSGQLILNARNSLQQILFFSQYLTFLGQEGLVGLGYSSDDAASLISIYTNMAAVANMCLGMAYTGPELPYNFLAATVPLWGGQ